MKILKRYTKKKRVRQRRQLQWQRDVRMTILCARLETKEGEKELYRLARQRDRVGKDVLHVRVIKDKNGNVMVNSEAVLKRWK